MPELTGRTLLNRYRVDAFLGRGGMAEVYKAWDARRSVYIALKVLNEDLAEDYVLLRRFGREAQALELLQHPHIVRFFGFEESRGLAFLVMEYIDGVTLRRQLKLLERPLTLPEALAVLEPVCSALHYAHTMGIYHCDVKPANIFIEQGGRVVLGDFGIARLTESATVTFSTPGTPAYMSPEQCRGEGLDAQTDVYSLGITTYEVLTLDRPFKGETEETTGSRGERVRWEQMNLPPPQPRSVNPGISPAAEAAVLRALEKESERRQQAALEFYQDLSGTGAVQPASTVPWVVEPEAPSPVPPPPPPPPPDSREEGTGIGRLLPTRGASIVMAGIAGVVLIVGLLAFIFSQWLSRASTTSNPDVSVATVITTPILAWTLALTPTLIEPQASPQLAATVTPLLSVATPTAPVIWGEWTMFMHDTFHTGFTADTLTLPLMEAWTFQTSGKIRMSSPAVANALVYIGSSDGQVHALAVATGEQRWAFQTGGEIISSPAVAYGMVIVGSQDGRLYALDSLTGQKRWEFSAGDGVDSSPTIADNVAYVGSNDGLVYAVDVTTGQQRWDFHTGARVFSSPAYADGVLYIGSDDGHLYALDADSGQQLWRFFTGAGVGSSPAVAKGKVYVGDLEGRVYAVNANTGQKVWEVDTGEGWVLAAPAIAGDRVYVASFSKILYALDAEGGEVLWTFAAGDIMPASPSVVSDLVLIGSHNNLFYALDAETGQKRWEFAAGESIGSSAAVAEGMVFVGCDDGKLYAFQGSDLAPTLTSTPYPAPSPTLPPSTPFISCPDVSGPLASVWSTVRNRVGCATDSHFTTWVAEEAFQNGWMYWWGDDNRVYAVYDRGRWESYASIWQGGEPEFSCLDADMPAQSPPTPKRGFGKIWCIYPNVRQNLGWATEGEHGFDATVQHFEYGLMLRTEQWTWVFYDDGSWERR